MSNGYVVESFADAPMRVRAWFENEGDAREYGRRFGASARVTAADLPTFVLEMAYSAPAREVRQLQLDLSSAHDEAVAA